MRYLFPRRGPKGVVGRAYCTFRCWRESLWLILPKGQRGPFVLASPIALWAQQRLTLFAIYCLLLRLPSVSLLPRCSCPFGATPSGIYCVPQRGRTEGERSKDCPGGVLWHILRAFRQKSRCPLGVPQRALNGFQPGGYILRESHCPKGATTTPGGGVYIGQEQRPFGRFDSEGPKGAQRLVQSTLYAAERASLPLRGKSNICPKGPLRGNEQGGPSGLWSIGYIGPKGPKGAQRGPKGGGHILLLPLWGPIDYNKNKNLF